MEIPSPPSPAHAVGSTSFRSDWSWLTLTAYAAVAAACWVAGQSHLAHGSEGLSALTADPSLYAVLVSALAWTGVLAPLTVALIWLHRRGEWTFHAVVGVCLGLAIARLWGPEPRLFRVEPMLANWAGVLPWPWAFVLETAFWFGLLAGVVRATVPSEPVALAETPGSTQPSQPAEPGPQTDLPRVPSTAIGFAEVSAGSLLGLLGIGIVMMGVFDLGDLHGQLWTLLLLVVAIIVAHQAARRFWPSWLSIGTAESPNSTLLSAPVWQLNDTPAVRTVSPAEHTAAIGWSMLLSVGLLTVLVRGEDAQSSLFGIAAAFLLGGAATIGLRPRTAAGLDLRGVWLAGGVGMLAYAVVGVHVLLTGGPPTREVWWARPGLLTLPVDWLAAGGLGAALSTRMSLAQELIWWPTRTAAGELARLSGYLGLAPDESRTRALELSPPLAATASAESVPTASPGQAVTDAVAASPTTTPGTVNSKSVGASPMGKPTGKGKKKRR